MLGKIMKEAKLLLFNCKCVIHNTNYTIRAEYTY